jgi:hypothetical protein
MTGTDPIARLVHDAIAQGLPKHVDDRRVLADIAVLVKQAQRRRKGGEAA